MTKKGITNLVFTLMPGPALLENVLRGLLTPLKFTMLRHVEYFTGINSCKIHSALCFTYFLYHVEDEDLASISYNCYNASKKWCVTPLTLERPSKRYPRLR